MTYPAGPFTESMLYGRYVTRHATITMAAGSTGALNQHDLFTVSGPVQAIVVGYCGGDLTSGGGATISVGTTNVVAGCLAVTGFDALDAGMMWIDNAPSECEAESGNRCALVSANITYNVLVATITGGELDFICFWTPLAAGATVT